MSTHTKKHHIERRKYTQKEKISCMQSNSGVCEKVSKKLDLI
jgi:hypothetical protein